MADIPVTPARELRAAAAKLKERASVATEGPWKAMCLGSEGCLVIRDHGTARERGRGRVARFGSKDWQPDHADSVYVAMMHPDVALAVAAWLEATARDADRSLAYEDGPEGPCCAEPSACGGHDAAWLCDRCGNAPGECGCWDAALAAARVILGTGGESGE